MKVFAAMIANLLALGLLVTMVGLPAHAASVSGQGSLTGEVVAQAFDSRHIHIGAGATEQRYRIALAARIILLDGQQGDLEDIMLGDEVLLRLDNETGDVLDLSVISQH